MIYLACPYSHENDGVRELRYEAITIIASLLIAKGEMVISPITHSHPIAKCGKLPTEWEYWKEFDRKLISMCDYVDVVMFKGWEESTGIKSEIMIAKELVKSVRYRDGNGELVKYAEIGRKG